MQTVTAEWHRVVGYERYLEATRCGQIRTIDQQRVNKLGQTISRRGKLLSRSTNGGRAVVYFRDLAGKVHAIPVANAIVATFIRPLLPNEKVSWLDGDRDNNDVSNLTIVARTPRKQMATAQ